MNNARLVVIGAGIVGQSVTYHLAKLGWKDIVVIDQGPIQNTGGSTSHAPGLIFQTNGSKFMTNLARYSVDLYSQLSHAGKVGAVKVGGVEFARTKERLQELKRRSGLSKSWGLPSHLLTPAQCEDMFPFFDREKVLGGYFVPDDSLGDGVTICNALMEESTKLGAARFIGNVAILGINHLNGRIQGVVTDQGTFDCDMVLCCAGIWGPLIGKMVGQSLPLYPMEHQYLKTEPLKELASFKGEERRLPIIRDQDRRMYYRAHGDCLGIGNYFHRSLPLAPEKILSPKEAKVMPSVREFTEEDFAQARDAAIELFPMLKGANYSYRINGLFSFTPDGGPLLGEVPGLKGFWVAEAIWLTHAGGVGRLMAEWLHAGYPQESVHEGEILRFHDYAKTQEFIRKRAMTNYKEVYDIIHPKQQREELRNIRVGPVHQKLVEQGAVFFDSNGYEKAQWFEENAKAPRVPLREKESWAAKFWSPTEATECLATRKSVALYDLSAFCIFEVKGPGACSYMQYLSTSNMDVVPGRVVYTNWLDDSGKSVADLTISRIEKETYWVVSGNGTGKRDWAWLQAHLPQNGSVQLRDLSLNYAVLGLWGPKARDLLAEICDDDISHQNFKYFNWKDLEIGEIPVRAFRVSYVGELGWELYVGREMALSLWDKIWKAGARYDLVAAGAQAFDSLRIEKGYRFWGQDMDANHTPLEAGLGFIVHWQKENFKGKTALEAAAARPLAKKLVSLVLDDRESVLLGKEPIIAEGKVVGYVTSACFGYTVDKFVALGWLEAPYYEEGRKVQIEYLGRTFSASVIDGPIFDAKGEKIRC